MDCNWNTPGSAPLRGHGNVAIVIKAHGLRGEAEILEKIRRMDPDGVVGITRDGIVSFNGAAVSGLRDMASAGNKVCVGPVKRDKWAPDHMEYAMVYCSTTYANECVAVPPVCENLSRITWTRAPERRTDLYPLPVVVIDPASTPPMPPAWAQPLLRIPGTAVPAPGTLALVAAALLALALASRKPSTPTTS